MIIILNKCVLERTKSFWIYKRDKPTGLSKENFHLKVFSVTMMVYIIVSQECTVPDQSQPFVCFTIRVVTDLLVTERSRFVN
jgi:hypothetical protein